MRGNTLYVFDEQRRLACCTQSVPRDIPGGRAPIILLYHLATWVSPRNIWRWPVLARRFKKRTGGRIIFCTNERSERRWLRLVGLEAEWLNHNLHVNENIFTIPTSSMEARYDAVYAAQLSQYKRLELAAKIGKLYVITYSSRPPWNLHEFCPELSHAEYNRQWIPEEAVRDVYWSSKAGLALSKYEGAMLSSMEYMLTGLPVVSTRCRGGRDQFAEPDYWFRVDANASAVAEGVKRASESAVPRAVIRERVLAKVKVERLKYLNFLQQRFGLAYPTAEKGLEAIWGGDGLRKLGRPIDAL